VPRNYVYAIVGALAVGMASAGAYGMLSTHLIQPSTGPDKMPDYSSQLDSLNTQVGSINSQVNSLRSQMSAMNTEVSSINDTLASFGMIKTNLSDIHEKLADLQNLSTNVADIQSKLSNIANASSQTPASTGKILLSLDKQTYLPGDTVHISATGADPLKVVEVQLLDSNGFALTGQTTWADSSGSILDGLQLSSALLPGEYQIKLSSGDITTLQQITVGSSPNSTSSYTLTAQTDKGIYQGGDMIQVTGMALPSSTVTAVMQSPSDITFTSSSTANSDGSYTLIFSTSQSYESGTWSITVTNLSQTKVTSIYMQSSGLSNGSNTFTAQTDKASYQLGDMIQVTGTAQPSSSVTAVLTNPSQGTYSSSTTVNSDGTWTILFSTSTSYETGNWNVDVSNLGQSKTLDFTLGTSSSSGSSTFTAQTDNTSYHQGDMVQIAGDAQPGSSASATLVSPSGNTYDTSAVTNSNGNYVMFFSTTGSYPTGNWYVEVNNLGQTKILTFTLQPA
jgi:prefoldin subunit 5